MRVNQHESRTVDDAPLKIVNADTAVHIPLVPLSPGRLAR